MKVNEPRDEHIEHVIQSDKYYDAQANRTLIPEDGCPLGEWLQNGPKSQKKFGFHDAGFAVFLNAPEINQLEEYEGHDPYGVIEDSGEPSAFHQRRFDWTIKLLQRALQDRAAGARVLDLGCGRGHITAKIHEQFPTTEVSGLDCSLSAIEYARQQYPEVDFVVADAYCPPYCSGYFDIVICNNIWEHVPDPMRLLEGIKRILAPEGVVIISTPSRYRLGNLMRVILGKPVKFISRHHVTEYTVGQVIEQLRWGGFDAEAFDSPLRLPATGLSNLLLRKLLAPMLRRYLKLTASHHSLEWTVFYLARRCARQ